jgi:hypothetical protein
MDGLDIYIDDYGKPDPIPASMLRSLLQSRVSRLLSTTRKASDDGRNRGAIPDGAARLARHSRRLNLCFRCR